MIQQVFGDQILSCTQVFQLHAWFKTSRTSMVDDKHTGRSTSCTTPETIALIKELVHQDQRWTIHNIDEEVGISYGTCQQVLTKNCTCTVLLLHRDNTLSHASNLIQQFLAKHKVAVIPHPLYSPDLAPCGYFLFPKNEIEAERMPVWYH
jgi:hypothetical protein